MPFSGPFSESRLFFILMLVSKLMIILAADASALIPMQCNYVEAQEACFDLGQWRNSKDRAYLGQHSIVCNSRSSLPYADGAAYACTPSVEASDGRDLQGVDHDCVTVTVPHCYCTATVLVSTICAEPHLY